MRNFLILFLALGNTVVFAQPTTKLNTQLADKLNQIYDLDQKYRTSSDWKMMMKQDSVNQIEVIKILNEQGWLGPEDVGPKGYQAIFLVIQHAELPVQEKYLPLMREAVKNKKAKMKDLALLEDRVLMRLNKKQIYGSQLVKSKEGNWVAYPIEDAANVDRRRTEIGLEPISNYLNRFGIEWNLEEHMRQQNEKTTGN